jgi:hypothetical protein
VFLLSKQERYFYDADAIAEPNQTPGRVLVVPDDGKNASAKAGAPDLRRTAVTGTRVYGATRNARSVWTVATQPYRGAHFATMPPALAERCVLAGTSPQACERCGAPWARVVERTPMVLARSDRTHPMGRTRTSGTMLEPPTSTTLGWEPTCRCEGAAGTGRCVVLDPFGGAGTTALVADRLGRDAILCELNADYAALATERLKGDAGLFADVAADEPEAA